MVVFIIGLLIMGLVVGALARLLVPGPDPMGIGATILLGIVGAIVGGLVGHALFGNNGGGFLAALVAAVVLLLVWRAASRRTV